MLPFVFTADRFVFPVGAPQEVIKMTKASPKKTAIRINPPPILRSYTDGFSKYQCCELFAYILWDYMRLHFDCSSALYFSNWTLNSLHVFANSTVSSLFFSTLSRMPSLIRFRMVAFTAFVTKLSSGLFISASIRSLTSSHSGTPILDRPTVTSTPLSVMLLSFVGPASDPENGLMELQPRPRTARINRTAINEYLFLISRISQITST